MGEDNVVRDEYLYTYEAAVNRYERERYHEWLCRQNKLNQIKYKRKERRRKLLNQKLVGFIGTAVITLITILAGDITCIALSIPFVFALMSNKIIF